MDLETRLRHDLHERSANLAPHGSGPAAARRAGARRRRRQQLTSVTVSVTLVGAATAAVFATRDTSDHAQVNVGGAGITDEQAGTAPPFDWSVLDEHSAIGQAPAVITGADGTLYALSTAPGESVSPVKGDEWVPAPQTLYSSTDGTHWQTRPVGDLWIGALAERDGVLYALGTAPATAAVGATPTTAAVAAWSTDGGATWTHAELPIPLDGAGPSGSNRHVSSQSVASGAAGVVAAVSTFADLDLATLLPAGADQGYGVQVTTTGLDVLGPLGDPAAVAAKACPAGWTARIVDDPPDPKNVPTVTLSPANTVDPVAVPVPTDIERGVGKGLVQCTPPPDSGQETLIVPLPVAVVAQYTWAELNLDPAIGASLGRLTQHLFVAPDGKTFEEVAVPFGAGAQDVQILATADGYVALVGTYAVDDPAVKKSALTITAWHSADGRTWTPLDAPALTDLSYVVAAGIRDGELIVVEGGGGRILRSTDGRTWTATDVADALGGSVEPGTKVRIDSAGIGPAGIALAVDAVEPSAQPSVTHDGVTLAASPTGGAQILDAATGAVLAEIPTTDRAEVTDVVRFDPSAPDIIVYDPATGAERTRFSWEDLKRSLSPIEAGVSLLVTSTDGVHFGATPLADLMGGAEGYVGWISVSDRVLVNVSRANDGASPEDRVLLVGTPPR